MDILFIADWSYLLIFLHLFQVASLVTAIAPGHLTTPARWTVVSAPVKMVFLVASVMPVTDSSMDSLPLAALVSLLL